MCVFDQKCNIFISLYTYMYIYICLCLSLSLSLFLYLSLSIYMFSVFSVSPICCQYVRKMMLGMEKRLRNQKKGNSEATHSLKMTADFNQKVNEALAPTSDPATITGSAGHCGAPERQTRHSLTHRIMHCSQLKLHTFIITAC